MPQFDSRYVALRAWKNFSRSKSRFEKQSFETVSPMEVELLRILVFCDARIKHMKSLEYSNTKIKRLLNKEKQGLGLAKSVGKALDLWPIPDWVEPYIKTVDRMRK